MKNIRYWVLFFAIVLVTSPLVKAQSNSSAAIDQIVAVVNDHTILKSEVDSRVRNMLYRQKRNGRNVTFQKQMWYRVLNSMVQNFVLLEHAQIDSVTVSDDQVDRRIEQRIQRIVQQVGSREALEEQVGKSLLQLKADLREQYRRDLTIRSYRSKKLSSVEITRPEVTAFFNKIPTDSIPEVPEQVAVSQIVATPPPNKQAREEAFQLAKALRDSIINYNKSIVALAKKYSDGPVAEDGGKLPLMPIDDLVPPYAAAAAALEPGEISKVVESDFGFHVIRLDERRGDMIATHNILISIDKNSYNEEAAIQKLKAIRDSLMSNDKVTFAKVARKKSEDPTTSKQGGRILQPQTGKRMLNLESLNPALYRIVLLLEEGEISKPKPFNVGKKGNARPAYRIVRLDKQVSAHTASLKTDYNMIKQLALQNKKMRIMRNWIKNMKKSVYIEYKIPVPPYLKETTAPKVGSSPLGVL